jgi:hypothetical protein
MIYEIRVKGHLPQDWSEWLEGMTINRMPDGETVLAGQIPDQAALFGILMKVQDLGLFLIAVNPVEPATR